MAFVILCHAGVGTEQQGQVPRLGMVVDADDDIGARIVCRRDQRRQDGGAVGVRGGNTGFGGDDQARALLRGDADGLGIGFGYRDGRRCGAGRKGKVRLVFVVERGHGDGGTRGRGQSCPAEARIGQGDCQTGDQDRRIAQVLLPGHRHGIGEQAEQEGDGGQAEQRGALDQQRRRHLAIGQGAEGAVRRGRLIEEFQGGPGCGEGQPRRPRTRLAADPASKDDRCDEQERYRRQDGGDQHGRQVAIALRGVNLAAQEGEGGRGDHLPQRSLAVGQPKNGRRRDPGQWPDIVQPVRQVEQDGAQQRGDDGDHGVLRLWG